MMLRVRPEPLLLCTCLAFHRPLQFTSVHLDSPYTCLRYILICSVLNLSCARLVICTGLQKGCAQGSCGGCRADEQRPGTTGGASPPCEAYTAVCMHPAGPAAHGAGEAVHARRAPRDRSASRDVQGGRHHFTQRRSTVPVPVANVFAKQGGSRRWMAPKPLGRYSRFLLDMHDYGGSAWWRCSGQHIRIWPFLARLDILSL